MNPRQKTGVGMIISGGITVGVGVITYLTTKDPTWVQIVLTCLSFIFPAVGLVVNLPARTD